MQRRLREPQRGDPGRREDVDCRAVARKDVTFPYSIFYFPLPFFIFFVIFFPLRKKIISF
ncbi:hypothetical protein CO026_03095 [Candidatus Kaiserbacteria bacterium CG_4_9_14_0_2_um_filter_41_32]|uniref:Uncharacterized protein n=1 Tax=Candidatus Kaiserbacteria bacterium CG_4_9_14_0_2_um_filter_41_32 TaxID=1974601 RepID=A0A2M8FE51_9BACT|nr:MAG: hypothetical protein CO026_03095 [Candidatus Kaiserbacteria bacterium CG_4_9_14_0_2_um_filter_41_32]